jgi:hypothetical protein
VLFLGLSLGKQVGKQTFEAAESPWSCLRVPQFCVQQHFVCGGGRDTEVLNNRFQQWEALEALITEPVHRVDGKGVPWRESGMR